MEMGTSYLPKRISADANSCRASLKVSSSNDNGIDDVRHVNHERKIRMRGSLRLQSRSENEIMKQGQYEQNFCQTDVPRRKPMKFGW
jgi:hypothetical protein